MSDQMMDDLTAMDELLTENPTLAKNCTPTPSPSPIPTRFWRT